MKFDVGDGRGHRVVSTTSWALANFFARLISLAGSAGIVGYGMFPGETIADPTYLCTYEHGRAVRFFAGSPPTPSIWP